MSYIWADILSDAPGALDSLRAQWDAGIPASQIGLRYGVTKSAILGKVHREHFPPRSTTGPNRPGRKRKHDRKPSHRLMLTRQVLGQLALLTPRVTLSPLASLAPKKPTTPPKPVVQPSARRCEYRAGHKPDWRQCEAMAIVGSVYCDEHHRLCHIKVHDLREDAYV